MDVRNTLKVLMLLNLLTYVPRLTAATTLAATMNKLKDKLTVPSKNISDRMDRHYAKIEQFNSLKPSGIWPENITDEEEEILSAIEAWGGISSDQFANLWRDLQELRATISPENEDEEPWPEEELQVLTSIDYAMDAEETDDGWDLEDEQQPTTETVKSVSLVTNERPTAAGYGFGPPIRDVDPIAATAQRPRILDDSTLSPLERNAVRKAALANMGRVVRASKCLLPQARWLSVRQLAPAADTVYMPPCVQLHRCMADSGCCYSETEVCAPIDGEHVAIPLYLNKADGNLTAARMLFYNHTRCACVPRDGEGQRDAAGRGTEPPRFPTEDSGTQYAPSVPTTPIRLTANTQPHTAPPQLRMCACPTLFVSRPLTGGGCICTCAWPEATRRRECLSLARGREHFGITDRRCISSGQCTRPTCEYGPYERAAGRCPPRRYRRTRTRYQKAAAAKALAR